MIVGIYLALTLPKIYEASTLILVEAQRVPQSYVQSVVSYDFDARINTISQQILSRTNLEKIINDLQLFSQSRNKKNEMHMEEKIETMRKLISVKITHTRGRANSGADSFTISYKGGDPAQIVNVVNTLASYFINENLKVREEQAIGTSEFLDGELLSMRQKLEEVEEVMKEYRRAHMGELPEQLESNLRIYDRIDQQLNEKKQRLNEEQQKLIIFENQLAASGQNAPAIQTSGVNTSQPTELERQRELLANLKSKYTEQHPDILRLQKTIADLEKEENSRAASALNDRGGADKPVSRATLANQRQLNDMNRLIRELTSEIAELEAQKIEYKSRVENTPKREQELMTLKRDYQNIQKTYSSLLNRKLEAEISVNMEKKQKGERFRVIDVAKKPEKPVEPDLNRLFVMILAIGMGFGAGAVVLLEYLDTSFKNTADVESYLGLPVIATIPQLFQQKDHSLRKLHQVSTMVSIVISIGLFASFALIILSGPERVLAMIR